MIALLLALALQAAPVLPAPAQEAEDAAVLQALSAPLPVAGGPLWVTLLTNRSMEALWRDDPARATLQIEVSNAGTSFYVMGLATRPVTLAPEARIEQDGRRFEGKVVNVAHLDGQQVPEGAAMLGLIEFAERIDVARPFVLSVGAVRTRFAIAPGDATRWRAVTAPPGQGF